VETLTDAPKQEERKLNLRFMGFEAKEGEIEKELVEKFNTELLQVQMTLHAKVVVTTQQWPVIAQTSTPAIGTRPGVVLLKFTRNEDRQAALQRCKGLAGTKLGFNEDLTPVQQAHKSKLWLMFKEAKAAGKRAF
jgi:hypothetical protein